MAGRFPKSSEEEAWAVLKLAGVAPRSLRYLDSPEQRALGKLVEITWLYQSRKAVEERGPLKPRRKQVQDLHDAVCVVARHLGNPDIEQDLGFEMFRQTLRGYDEPDFDSDSLEFAHMEALSEGRDLGVDLIPTESILAMRKALRSIIDRGAIPRAPQERALTVAVRELMKLWMSCTGKKATAKRRKADNVAAPTPFSRFALAFLETSDGPATAEESALRLERITTAVGNLSPTATMRRDSSRGCQAPRIE